MGYISSNSRYINSADPNYRVSNLEWPPLFGESHVKTASLDKIKPAVREILRIDGPTRKNLLPSWIAKFLQLGSKNGLFAPSPILSIFFLLPVWTFICNFVSEIVICKHLKIWKAWNYQSAWCLPFCGPEVFMVRKACWRYSPLLCWDTLGASCKSAKILHSGRLKHDAALCWLTSLQIRLLILQA